jgi:hypothetical protein
VDGERAELETASRDLGRAGVHTVCERPDESALDGTPDQGAQ